MKKRGQVTVFIIVGILILLVFAGFFYLRTIKTVQPAVPATFAAVKLYLDNCLEKVTNDAVIRIGQQGGYYHLQEPILFTEFLPTIPYIAETEKLEYFQQQYLVPYYFYEGNQLMPLPETVMQELELYVEENLDGCVNHFAPFIKEGFIVEEGTIDVSVSLLPSRTQFQIDYPIKISRADSTQVLELDSFEVVQDVPLARIMETIKMVLAQQQQHPEGLVLTDLTELSRRYDFRYDVDYRDTENLIFLYYFDRQQKDDYVFAYAGKYDWQDELIYHDDYLDTRVEEYEETIEGAETSQ